MFKNKVIILGVFTILGIILIPTSNAELWDLVIQTTIENAPIFPGDAPIITGIITDHASKPMEKVKTQIRTGHDSIVTFTDENGKFRVELSNLYRIPGMYRVNILADAPDGKTGFVSTDFQVKGTLSPTSLIEGKLSTQEAIKYLYSNSSNFEKDPIGFILYNHYQELLQEYYKADEKSEKIKTEQIAKEQQKKNAADLRSKAIEEFNPKQGIFSGKMHDNYVNSLNPSVRETIANQLNFTKNLTEEAQKIRDQIIENGGTEEEARQAYLEKISTSKETLEKVGFDIKEQTILPIGEIITNNFTETSVDSQIQDINQTDVSGVDVKISSNGTNFFVNVNGTVIEFVIDGDKIIQITNSTK